MMKAKLMAVVGAVFLMGLTGCGSQMPVVEAAAVEAAAVEAQPAMPSIEDAMPDIDLWLYCQDSVYEELKRAGVNSSEVWYSVGFERCQYLEPELDQDALNWSCIDPIGRRAHARLHADEEEWADLSNKMKGAYYVFGVVACMPPE